MRARYGLRDDGTASSHSLHPSPIWREIRAREHLILDHSRWLIGQGSSVHVVSDAWITSLPIARWPTFVSPLLDDSLMVRDLIIQETHRWDVDSLSRYFGPPLIQRILAIPIPVHSTLDLRVWDRSCSPAATTRSLIQLCQAPPPISIPARWIWRLPAHPRVLLFLWKLAWNRLPTCSLLHRRGLLVPPICPVCHLHDETTEHALFTCDRARRIWRIAGLQPSDMPPGGSLSGFLDNLQRCPPFTASRVCYITYHIWLSRNALVFEDRFIPALRVLRLADSLASEFSSTEAAVSSLDALDHWVSPAASAADRQVILVSWEPPPPDYIKLNFDRSVRESGAGYGFIVRDAHGRPLAAGGGHLFDVSVPEAELRAAWAGIAFVCDVLRAARIIIEGDSATVISWLREDTGVGHLHPLLYDISCYLSRAHSVIFRHIFREANSAADWVASYVAHHTAQVLWSPAVFPPELSHCLLFDSLGCSRTRLV